MDVKFFVKVLRYLPRQTNATSVATKAVESSSRVAQRKPKGFKKCLKDSRGPSIHTQNTATNHENIYCTLKQNKIHTLIYIPTQPFPFPQGPSAGSPALMAWAARGPRGRRWPLRAPAFWGWLGPDSPGGPRPHDDAGSGGLTALVDPPKRLCWRPRSR